MANLGPRVLILGPQIPSPQVYTEYCVPIPWDAKCFVRKLHAQCVTSYELQIEITISLIYNNEVGS